MAAQHTMLSGLVLLCSHAGNGVLLVSNPRIALHKPLNSPGGRYRPPVFPVLLAPVRASGEHH